jgi:hypothetical protein
MNMRQSIIAVVLGAGLSVAAASAHAGTIDINLGASSQDFTLYGMGASDANGGSELTPSARVRARSMARHPPLHCLV